MPYRTMLGAALGAAVLVVALVLSGCNEVSVPPAPAPGVTPPAPTPAVPAADPAIYIAGADGLGATRLTGGRAPAWSPDGRRIAFYRNDGWTYVLAVDSTAERRVTRGTYPAWSPDGGQLVVDRSDAIYVVDVETGSEVRLAMGDYPSWAPDGKRIAFDDGSGISVINVDGTGYRTIVHHGLDADKHPGAADLFAIKPVWSPWAGWQQIAFTLQDVDGGVPVATFVVDVDVAENNGNLQSLSGDTVSAGPSWARDAVRVAYVMSTPQWRGVIIHPLCCDPNTPIRLPDENANPVNSWWSPDMKIIGFETYKTTTGESDLWVGPGGGGDAHVWISDAANLAWTRDGQHIAFERPSGR